MRRIRSGLLIGWCCLLTPAVFAADDANTLNNRGVEAAKAGSFAAGVADLREALRLDPSNELVRRNLSGILTDWANLLNRAGSAEEAEGRLREAVQLDPSNAAAKVQLGDLAYFHHSNFTQAVDYWKQALSQLPSADRRAIADRIAQAGRDATIEREFASHRTTHFDLRVPNGTTEDTAALVGQILELAYRDVYTALGGGPSRITAIIYPERDLQRTYYARDWALGFYDGRLRILGSEIGSDELRTVVLHELAHAFLHHLYGETLPTWIHEGFAQVQEGDRPRHPEELEQERAVRAGTAWVPLKWLDRRFAQPSGREDVAKSYVEARLVVDHLLRHHGAKRFHAFLAALSQGTEIEQAYDSAFSPDRWAATDRNMLR